MAAAIDIITRAMRRAGVLAAGEAPTAAETQDALAALNDILELWSIDSLTVYRRTELAHQMTAAASYTIGPGADIEAQRPTQIIGAFTRLAGFDLPVEIVGDARFNSVAYKALTGRPEFLRYDAAMPAGRIDLWPVPDDAYSLHLTVAQQLERAEAPADEIVTPPGYARALVLALAVDLCGEFHIPFPPGLPDLAVQALAEVKRNNIEPVAAVFDAALTSGPRPCFREG